MQRLFERLTHAQERRERLAESRLAGMPREIPAHVASIQAHLTRLLNTRRGSACVDGEYGIPMMAVSPNNKSLADRVAILNMIRTAITRYETRLVDVTVTIDTYRRDQMALGIGIKAQVRPGLLPAGTDQRVALRAALMTDGTLVFD